MSNGILEADWKVLRQLHPVALERFCQSVLSEIVRLASDSEKGSHERYLAVFDLLRRRDKELANAFDDMRRSTALRHICSLQSLGLLTGEEFARFSPGTRETALSILGIDRA
jgi:hypothetical protein